MPIAGGSSTIQNVVQITSHLAGLVWGASHVPLPPRFLALRAESPRGRSATEPPYLNLAREQKKNAPDEKKRLPLLRLCKNATLNKNIEKNERSGIRFATLGGEYHTFTTTKPVPVSTAAASGAPITAHTLL